MISRNGILLQLFDVRNLMVTCNPKNGRYLGATATFRGPIDMRVNNS